MRPKLITNQSAADGIARPIEVLNLGAGVQSSTVLLMSIHGELPKLDHAIFADTGWEPSRVYRWLDWLQPIAERAGVKVHRVSRGNIREDHVTGMLSGRRGRAGGVDGVDGVENKGQRWGSMPFFVMNPDGTQGLIRRQCTKEYKIEVIERHLKREILGFKPRARMPKQVIVRRWYGISYDEMDRMRTVNADGNWVANWYPLVEKRITRQACLLWMDQHGYPEPPRSACVACPFRSMEEWRRLQRESPKEFADAVEFDKTMRKCGGISGDVFVHRKMKPLDEVDLTTDVDRGQGTLWDIDGFRDECQGVCGV
jgi:hypothetical protein